jgi:hypothetical protein
MTTKINTEKQQKMANNGFSKFCEETSLPGWSYLNHEMSKVWKILWILFLFFLTLLSVFVVLVNIQQYQQVCKNYAMATSLVSLASLMRVN